LRQHHAAEGKPAAELDYRAQMKEMENAGEKRRIIRIKHRVHKQIDCHKWASKMEIQRLVSSKPLQVVPKPAASQVD
jgi:hypothetical protein